jgi:hypothetical protein
MGWIAAGGSVYRCCFRFALLNPTQQKNFGFAAHSIACRASTLTFISRPF